MLSETAGSVQDDRAEKPFTIMEFEMSHPSAEDALETGKREVTSALSNAHGRKSADRVRVSPGSIPSHPDWAPKRDV